MKKDYISPLFTLSCFSDEDVLTNFSQSHDFADTPELPDIPIWGDGLLL